MPTIRALEVVGPEGEDALMDALSEVVSRYDEGTAGGPVVDAVRRPPGRRDPGLSAARGQGRRGRTNAPRTATALPAVKRAVMRTLRSG